MSKTKVARIIIATLCLAGALPLAIILGFVAVMEGNIIGVPFIACMIVWGWFVHDTCLMK